MIHKTTAGATLHCKEHYYVCDNLLRAGKQILNGEIGYEEGLNKIEWDDNDMRGAFQRKLNESNQDVLCGVDFVSCLIP